MKRTVIKAGVKTGTALLECIYALMKLFPQRGRVVILSRQSNDPSQDIQMLSGELEARGIETVVLCDRMGGGAAGAVRYTVPLLRQMRYLATSRVAVLDSYCIPACLLHKRHGLTVIQMWHALGAMKKFSKSILDKPEGKSAFIASLMKMHEGYDYIFTSSERARPAFAEAFGYPADKLTIMSLPRVDAIMDTARNHKLAEQIRERYPVLRENKTILYAPTLRINEDLTQPVQDLIDATGSLGYNMVVKLHPLTELAGATEHKDNVIFDSEYSTTDMMAVASYVITDYSAVTYDAALRGLPIYFYAFDKDRYLKDREFYLDYDRDMPGPVCLSAREVASEIAYGNADEYRERSIEFAREYIEKQDHCTSEIADLIESILKKG